MPDIQITTATAADIPQIMRLLADDPIGRTRETPDDLQPYLHAFDRMTDDPGCTLLVAKDGDIVVGALQMNIIAGLSYIGADRCLIEDLRVIKDRRQQGIGRHLVEAALARSWQDGCTIAELFVHADRSDAHAFYVACGFTGSHRGFRIMLDGG